MAGSEAGLESPLGSPLGSFDIHASIISETEGSLARSGQLLNERRELSRRTGDAMRKEKQAETAKARLQEMSKYADYEFEQLRAWQLEEESPLNRAVPKASPIGKFVSSSAPDETTFETAKQRQIVEKMTHAAYEKVREANAQAEAAQKAIQETEVARNERLYLEAQDEYKKRVDEEKMRAREELNEFDGNVKQGAEMRRQHEKTKFLERQKTTIELQRMQAEEEAKLAAIEREQKRLKLLTQEKWKAAHIRKKEDEERREREIQKQIVQVRTREKAESIKFEEAKEKRRQELAAEARRNKQEAWSHDSKAEAIQKARTETEVKARFKASETTRVKREAEKRAQERADVRKNREAMRKKNEAEQAKKKQELREKAKALKQALKEAMAAQYEQDAKGKMMKKLDPTKELMKKMRKLEEEQARERQERDAALAAKEAAFIKAKKEEAFQRQLQVEAAHKDVADTMKKNQEKQLKDTLAREAAEKERFRRIAKEMREKIEEENRQRLEAERRAEEHLKEVKAAQYRADLAAHMRNETTKKMVANHRRNQQEMVWRQVMADDRSQTADEQAAKEEAMRLFSEQRDRKKAEIEETRQLNMHTEERKRLALAEKRAERAAQEAAAMEEELRAKAELVAAAADKLGSPKASPKTKKQGGSLAGLGLWSSPKNTSVKVRM